MATEIGPGATDNVVMVLINQHERARALLAELHETVAAVAEITRDAAEPFRELVELLATHEAAEELVVYPTLKTGLQEGHVAGDCLAEEHETKRMLAGLEKMGKGFFAFPDALVEFEQTLLAHAEHEEQAIFPLLEGRVDDEHRRRLAEDFRSAAARAPSHAHAHSPQGAVGNVLLGPFLATIDRLRDAAHS